MVSCVVTGLTEELVKEVQWKTSGDEPITAENGFEIKTTTLTDDNTQTTTLTVPRSETDIDKVYTCVITPNGNGATEITEEVNLKVFSK